MRKTSIPVVVVGATLPLWAWAQGQSEPYKYDWGPHMMWWGGGWYGMFFGPLIMILVLAVVIAAVVLIVRWSGGGSPWQGSPPQRKPLDILKERFARGEIDKAEFEERRRLLGE
jgi:putative membrane protein